MRLAALAAVVCTAVLAGCPNNDPPSASEISAALRDSTPGFDALREAADVAHAHDVLKVHEVGLQDLVIGESPARVRERYGEPIRRTHTAEGTWWEYKNVVKLASQLQPREDEKPLKDQIGMLRLLFVKVPEHIDTGLGPSPEPSADTGATAGALSVMPGWGVHPDAAGTNTAVADRAASSAIVDRTASSAIADRIASDWPRSVPSPLMQTEALTQIRAWAPGSLETRSMIRLLDPVARIQRKYGKPPHKLSIGWTGGEVWIYPAANVAFVVSPPELVEGIGGAAEHDPVRLVAGTIVGL